MSSKINVLAGFLLVLLCVSCTDNPETKPVSVKKEIKKKAGNERNIDLKIKRLNDIARFIAGMEVDSTSELYPLTKTQEWVSYSSEAKLVWDKFGKFSVRGIKWRDKEVPQAAKPFGTLFYPFGGPDFLFANMFFPNANKYILIGLEDPGSVPEVSSFRTEELKDILSLYKVAIQDVIQLSFFRTNDMNVELKTNAIDGTTPIIMLFMARAGKEITGVQQMELNEEGKLIASDGKGKNKAVAIRFRNAGDTATHYVYYLSTNLANPALKQNLPFKKFLGNIEDNSLSFVKSATYLMHKSYFSIIRNTVLNKSALVLQDDSGIAYKFFDKTKWSISLFGTYEKPINLFKDFYEPDLYKAFKDSSKPLNFRIGYDSKSHLLLAQKIEN